MSAIAAIFNLDGAPVTDQQLCTMTDAVAHRGPDGIGVWSSESVGLGSCLLKTTPQASFEQLPCVSDRGRYAVALDGRIDDRVDLAAALKLDPSTLATLPDSEMLLASYRKWGKHCVDRITGDFAFAIWDSTQQELFCGRDPIGVRMLHYYCDGRRFIAATEISQILSIVKAEPDPVSIALFLDSRSAPPERTFLEGIKKLPGGCQMTVSTAGPKVEIYWNPDPSDVLALKDDREYEERFLAIFKESVRSRMNSAGPVAISLSGGMDSTSILATAEHMRRTDSPDLPELRYYSNVYKDMDEVDETEYIRPTVEMYGTPGKMIESGQFDDDSLGSSPLGLRRAEPHIAPHEESHRKLFGEAQRNGSHVLLTGLGGDEVFTAGSGYLVDLFRAFNLRAIRREWRYFHRRAWLSAGLSAAGSLVPFSWRSGSDDDDIETAPWISERGRHAIDAAREADWRSDRSFKSHQQQEIDAWIQMRGGLPGYTWTDVTVAEYGLEPRHPFWDRNLAEFLVSVPPQVKYRFGYSKRLLRRAMKGILPETVRNRRYKTDFSSLYDVKSTQSQAEEISEFFRSPVLEDSGMVDPVSLQQAWSHYLGSASHVDNRRRTALWAAITLEQWLRQHVVDDGNENEKGASPSQRGSASTSPVT